MDCKAYPNAMVGRCGADKVQLFTRADFHFRGKSGNQPNIPTHPVLTHMYGPAVRSKKNALVCWQRRRIFITESVRAQNYRFLIQAMGLDRLMRVAPASISGFATLLPFGTLLLTTLSRNPIFSSSE
jgi:hypothetical protein